MEGAFCIAECWLSSKSVGKADLGGRLASLGSNGIVCFRTPSTEWHVLGKYGPRGELFIPELEGTSDEVRK